MSVRPVAVLELIKGSAMPFEIAVLDQDGNSESLSGADKASFTVRDKAGGATILQRDTVAGGLAIDVPSGTLIGSLTQLEADALTIGSYIAAASVHYSGPNRWIDSDPILARILPSVAAHP